MSDELMERVISDLLKYFLALDDELLQKHLDDPNFATKERVKTIDDLLVIIYPNDHLPPHFHVKSKDRKIDAKFTIENCELISGDLSSKNKKKIRAFAESRKGQMTLSMIWKRYHG
jgi:hypothetical protein